jgi:hypothetical protein
LELVMIVEEDLWAEVIPMDGSPQRSRVAQEFARWGTCSYWLALHLAVLCLLSAGAFAALAPEPRWQRLMSAVFLGFPPAFAAYSMGWLAFWTLKGASAIYDPVTSVLWLTFRILTSAALIAWRFLAWLATDLLLPRLRNVIAFLRARRHAVDRVSRICVAFALVSCSQALMAVVFVFGRTKRMGMQAAGVLARGIRGCMSSARMCAKMAYYALQIAFLGIAIGVWTCRRAMAWAIRLISWALIGMRPMLLRMIGACMELASACERATARLLVRTRRYSGNVWRVFIFSATFPVRLVAQILIRLISSAAWHYFSDGARAHGRPA